VGGSNREGVTETKDDRNASIMRLHNEGYSVREISSIIGLSKSGVHDIIRRKKGKSPSYQRSMALKEVYGKVEFNTFMNLIYSR
jgi:IS30 family transposase